MKISMSNLGNDEGLREVKGIMGKEKKPVTRLEDKTILL